MSEDRLVQLLIEIRETLQRNERELDEHCSVAQFHAYQQMYRLIEETRQVAIARASESAGGDDETIS